MVTRNVSNRRRNFGSSLVEFMVAAMLGGFALVMVGGIYISVQKSAAEKSKQLLLMQNINSALQQLKEDVQRAGFNGDLANSAKYSDVVDVVHIDSTATLFGYVYKVVSATSYEYRHVVYRYDNSSAKLSLCEKNHSEIITFSVASTSGVMGNCFSIFDPHQIAVNDFTLNKYALINSVESAFIQIRLSASLVDKPSVAHQVEVNIKQRNWL